MNPSQWERVKALFPEALAAAPGPERDKILEGADPDAVREVLRLIELHHRAGEFLSNSPSLAGRIRALTIALRPGQILAGRFEVTRLLGYGGMGQVYETVDRDLHQNVAIKVVNPDCDSTRFISEIQTARKVTHPNVCRIFDIERDGDIVFFTMELLLGETLSSRIKRGALPAAEAMEIARQICLGLGAAHKAGILHRDLKSGNIMIAPDGHSTITDFGLAKLIERAPGSGNTADNTLVGTVDYMAPEVLAGRPATIRSDIYSLGVVLYEAATGHLPFESVGPLASVVRRAYESPESPRSLNPAVPRAMDQAILSCLSPDSAARPASAEEVAARIVRVSVFSRRGVLIGGGVAGAALLFAAYRYNMQESPPSGIRSVLMAQIQNTTGDGRLDGMDLLLRQQLQQSARIDVLGEARTAEILDRMQFPKGGSLDVRALREIALRNGGTLVVYTNISRLGPELLLDVRTEYPSRPDYARVSWKTQFRANGEQDLLSRARDAATWIRQIAGESEKEIEAQNRSPEEITTFSWDALTLLKTAQDRRKEGKFDQAWAMLTEAVRIDPDFPSANREIADLLVSERKYKEGYQAWRRAIESAQKRQLNSRERYRIEAFYADDIGDLDRAEQINRLWMVTFPLDYLPHFLLGNVYIRQGRLPESSQQMLQASLLREHDAAVETNLTYNYLAQSRYDEARIRIDGLRAFASPDNLAEVEGKAQFILGEARKSEASFARMMASRGGDVRHRGSILAAACLAEQGRFQEASNLLTKLLPEDEANGAWQWRAQKLIWLAELARLQSRTDDSLRIAAAALRLDDGDLIQETGGVLLARGGMLEAASRALESLRSLPDLPRTRRRIMRLEGEIELERQRLPQALRSLQKASAQTTNWDLNDSLARALEITGDLAGAVVERKRLARLKAIQWSVAERSLPGAWAENVSVLIGLAERTGRAAEAKDWQDQLSFIRTQFNK